jgi:3-methyladenine DNA glycosylase/8-oxoguanine DNA glycosylase
MTRTVRSRLAFDPLSAVAHLRQADRVLARFIDTAGPFRLTMMPTRSVFGALAQTVVYQQLSNAAAATIFDRVLALPGGSEADLLPEQILTATDDELRAVGLSRAKQAALRDLAERAEAGSLPTLSATRRMDDDQIVERLTEVRGIGRWSAQMFLIFRLGRPDVLPAEDIGVRKGFAAVYGGAMPSAEELSRHGERWRPYRTVASGYLWSAVDGGL